MTSLMSFAQDIVGKIVLAMILIPIVWLGSCAVLAGGTAVAVNKVANSEFAGKAVKSHVEHSRRDRNDDWNRESTRNDFDHDYGGNAQLRLRLDASEEGAGCPTPSHLHSGRDRSRLTCPRDCGNYREVSACTRGRPCSTPRLERQ